MYRGLKKSCWTFLCRKAANALYSAMQNGRPNGYLVFLDLFLRFFLATKCSRFLHSLSIFSSVTFLLNFLSALSRSPVTSTFAIVSGFTSLPREVKSPPFSSMFVFAHEKIFIRHAAWARHCCVASARYHSVSLLSTPFNARNSSSCENMGNRSQIIVLQY